MIFLIRFNNSKDADDTTPIKQPALCCSKTNEDMRIYFLFFKLYCHSSYFTNSCPLSSSISIKVVSYCGLWCVCGFTVVCGVSVVTLWSVVCLWLHCGLLPVVHLAKSQILDSNIVILY